MIEKNPEIAVSEHWKGRFFTVWTGQAFSLIGSSLVQFALVWWLTRQTGSATVLATATLLSMLPQIFLGPFAGAVIDRVNRKAVMIVSDSLIALATLVLIYLFAIGHQSVWAIYIIMTIRSACSAFHYPSMQASTSLMVPQGQLARIAGLNQTLQGFIGIIAPPLGAFLINIIPAQGVLAVDVVTAAIAVGLLLVVNIPQPAKILAMADGGKKSTYIQDLKEGVKYMLAWPGLMAVAILAMLINFLLTPSSALIPLMVTKIYKGGAIQLGLLDSIFGVGVIVGGLALSTWGGFKKRIMTSMMGIIGIGIGILIFGGMPSRLFTLALSGVFIFGAMQVFANGPLFAILQATVEPGMQGRVLSLIGAGATAMSPLSLLVAGPISDALGIRTWFLVGGVACILATIVATFIPAVINIENNHTIVSGPAILKNEPL